jgi:hypothetical protein
MGRIMVEREKIGCFSIYEKDCHDIYYGTNNFLIFDDRAGLEEDSALAYCVSFEDAKHLVGLMVSGVVTVPSPKLDKRLDRAQVSSSRFNNRIAGDGGGYYPVSYRSKSASDT